MFAIHKNILIKSRNPDSKKEVLDNAVQEGKLDEIKPETCPFSSNSKCKLRKVKSLEEILRKKKLTSVQPVLT